MSAKNQVSTVVFSNLTHDLITHYGLKGSRDTNFVEIVRTFLYLLGSRNANVTEVVGMFFYMLGHCVGNRVAQERFQCFRETISRQFSFVLDKLVLDRKR